MQVVFRLRIAVPQAPPNSVRHSWVSSTVLWGSRRVTQLLSGGQAGPTWCPTWISSLPPRHHRAHLRGFSLQPQSLHFRVVGGPRGREQRLLHGTWPVSLLLASPGQVRQRQVETLALSLAGKWHSCGTRADRMGDSVFAFEKYRGHKLGAGAQNAIRNLYLSITLALSSGFAGGKQCLPEAPGDQPRACPS